MNKQSIEDKKKKNKLTRTNAKAEYEKYNELLQEKLQPVKVWVKNDPELSKHYPLFQRWFKAYRDNGGTIGIPTGAARGTVLLLERDWQFIKTAFLNRVRTSGIRGARGYGRKNKK